MRRLVVAAAARADLAEIARFTEERWGPTQRRRYISLLEGALQRLRANPHLGRKRPEIRTGYYTALAGRHIVFYQFSDEACEIVRVLHDRMDVHRHLDEDPK
jgi:toxin ParE1/3/4